ncbi:MAG TPA: transcriptional regulator [Candidatus Latescibacteria bacterium]|nr:transcriptional regulator [Candidatus Handelsmanbacteria bacterium]HIL08305.1 transcriptional regulator [Candidatus Latescibacterota bacterium]
MSAITPQLKRSWIKISPLLSIQSEREYDEAVERLNDLVDEVGTDEDHPLYSLLDTLGTVIYAYEQKHHTMPECRGGEILQYLMEEHDLTQSDLPEVGSQGVVSEIVRGKRELNVRQIRVLTERFNVSPAVFI